MKITTLVIAFCLVLALGAQAFSEKNSSEKLVSASGHHHHGHGGGHHGGHGGHRHAA